MSFLTRNLFDLSAMNSGYLKGRYELVEKYDVHMGQFYTDHVWHGGCKPTARIKGALPSVPSYSKPVKVRHHDISINVEDFDTNGTAYNKGRYTTHVDYQSCPTASWLINGTWFGSVNAEGVDYTDHRTTGTYLSVDGDMWAIPTVEDRPQSITVNTYSKGKAEYCSDYYDQYQYSDAGDCLYDDDVVFTRESGEEDEYNYY
jgi:hypothetical protein